MENVRVPSMILQPVVENAVNHGIRNIDWEGHIELSVERWKDHIEISVRDNGQGMTKEQIERVAYLVGHHHTYKDIDGLDYQILVEADFLVNYFEDGLDKEHIKKSAEKIFKTETGKKIVKDMFFPETFQKSETWAQDALQDLEDFIEEQGIYIRQ